MTDHERSVCAVERRRAVLGDLGDLRLSRGSIEMEIHENEFMIEGERFGIDIGPFKEWKAELEAALALRKSPN